MKRISAILAASMLVVGTMAGCGKSQSDTSEVESISETGGISTDVTENVSSAGGDSSEESDANSENDTSDVSSDENVDSSGSQFASINYGEDYTDLNASVKLITNRTDMIYADFEGENWDELIAVFNETYPNISVTVKAYEDYDSEATSLLNQSDWGSVMMIPGSVSYDDLPNYYMSYGTEEELRDELTYTSAVAVKDEVVYGIPSIIYGQGFVYNKQVFRDAGIEEVPTTPAEFEEVLSKIYETGNATPLYINYNDEWAMAAWDDFIGVASTGEVTYLNQIFPHSTDPFTVYRDGTHANGVYRLLYNAVSNGYVNDINTSSWTDSKEAIASGEAGIMAIGAWAVAQIQNLTDNPEDISFMPFPMSFNGVQYSDLKSDYKIGINKNLDDEETIAAILFTKFLVSNEGYAGQNQSLPILTDNTIYPEIYNDFVNVEFTANEPALEGEEGLMESISESSGLNIISGDGARVNTVVDAALAGESFDNLMTEWNNKWISVTSGVGE